MIKFVFGKKSKEDEDDPNEESKRRDSDNEIDPAYLL